MSLWAKSVNDEEQALEIEWATPGNVSQLKRAIALERRAIHLPDLYILNVRLDDSSDRRNNLSNEAHVSVPMPGEIGSSEDLPYFFSTATHDMRTEAASAVLRKPEYPASSIANEFPEIYDVFAQVCVEGTYIPNLRLQELVGLQIDEQDVINFKCNIDRSLRYVDTFRSIPDGSEDVLVDCNMHSLVSMMADLSGNKLAWARENHPEIRAAYLAGSKISNHCLCAASQVVLGTATSAIESSIRFCLPQLISVCGSACIELHRLGLQPELCVVPGIAMAGESCQFFAVYLLDDNFPVLVALSSALSPFGSMEHQLTIAQWCLRLVSFGVATADLLRLPCEAERVSTVVRLDMGGYFAKPVRNGWPLLNQMQRDPAETHTLMYSHMNQRLNRIMRLYEQLRLSCRGAEVDVKSLVLFPEGVVTVPQYDAPVESKALLELLTQECVQNGFTSYGLCRCPLILFPRLCATDGWGTDKPPATLRKHYIVQLRAAGDALNRAQVAHLDLRPANIMWRTVGSVGPVEASRVELQVIDFEDAEPFHHVIPAELVQTIVWNNNFRYPFRQGDEQVTQWARRFHNDYFVEAVAQWVLNDENDTYCEFMKLQGDAIYSYVLELEAKSGV